LVIVKVVVVGAGVAKIVVPAATLGPVIVAPTAGIAPRYGGVTNVALALPFTNVAVLVRFTGP